ncbi:MAG: hypothetical protein M1541_20255 [Acidobacteria bacterium]|nr:hypothetical protein [Acidobacteriota bacterium]
MREDPYEKRNRADEHPEIVKKLRERLAYHKQFAREEEPPERIPGKPVVYGEVENAQYGASIAEQMKPLHLKEQDEKGNRKKRREN